MSMQSIFQRFHTLLLALHLTLASLVFPTTDQDVPQTDEEQVVVKSHEERNEDESEPDPDPGP